MVNIVLQKEEPCSLGDKQRLVSTLSMVQLVVGKLLVLPNEMSFPIMENYGVPPPPQGMLRVKVEAV